MRKIFVTEEMKLIILVMFSNFSNLEAVKMEVCQIEMTNQATDFLKLRYQKWFRKMTFHFNILLSQSIHFEINSFRNRYEPIRDEVSMHLFRNSTQIQARPDSKRFLSFYKIFTNLIRN